MIFRKTLACAFVVTATLLFLFISGCVDSSKETITSTPMPPSNTPPVALAYGYITTIALDEMKTELIKLDDDYDKFEVETNVGTISYHDHTYQTHRVTLWRGDVKKIVNKVIEYELTTVIPSLKSEPKIFGYVTTITFDMKTELIKFSDNYDKYEIEENVGTVSYRGYTHQTHKVILWRGGTKRVINNVVGFSVGRRNIY